MTRDETTISVVLATYNGERHLQAQLDSLAAQRRPPTELIVCDDASDDGTVELITRFADASPLQVKLHRNPERLGWRENFQRGAALAGCTYIAFCDQDDVWRPDKLERVHASLDDDVTLLFHGAATIDETGRRTGRLARGPRGDSSWQPLAAPWWRTPLGFSMIVRRDLVQHLALWRSSIDQVDPSQRAAHDQWYWFLASVFGRTVFLHDELVDYRLHASNAMGHATTGPSTRDLLAAARATAAKCELKVLVLESRIDALRRMAPVDPVEQAAILKALDAFSAARVFDGRRIRMLTATHPIDRVRRLLELVRSRQYTRSPLPEGNAELVRDVLSVLVRPRREGA